MTLVEFLQKKNSSWSEIQQQEDLFLHPPAVALQIPPHTAAVVVEVVLHTDPAAAEVILHMEPAAQV